MYRLIFLIFIMLACMPDSSAQVREQYTNQNVSIGSYAYVRVVGKLLSKKLKVTVDLGDSDEQIEEGRELSDILTDKKSYSAVLNHMSDIGYKLVNTLDLTSTYEGSGGTSGIVYVMVKYDYPENHH